ncbi:hypothetical protein QR98_0014930 [Sarcoptes scabiei]|uniref:Uncharacterized protein n=1 Tax=Sarcoptes scabiei TaxID=52283 RepID=A0A131ZWJ4_SARSC|nr:hypothetical protein QR98_0014930 [Sarcoptes scabiei]
MHSFGTNDEYQRGSGSGSIDATQITSHQRPLKQTLSEVGRREEQRTEVFEKKFRKQTPPKSRPSNIPMMKKTDLRKNYSPTKPEQSSSRQQFLIGNSSINKSHYQKQQHEPNREHQNNQTDRNDFDRMFEEYSSQIEDLMQCLSNAEELLQTKSLEDHSKLDSITLYCCDDDDDETNSSMNVAVIDDFEVADGENSSRNQIKKSIQTTIFARNCFNENEKFMSQLTSFSERILQSFDRAKVLIDLCNQKQQSDETDSISLSSSTIRLEIAVQINTVNEKFGELRNNAIKHQQFLQQKLIKAQNYQLKQLDDLMSKTEEQITKIVPKNFEELFSSIEALERQIQRFEPLQKSMEANQELLSAVSKFVILDQSDQDDRSETKFIEQLEKLNERWSKICKITEDRGSFLYKLRNHWNEFEQEKNFLNEWLNRLEKRLNDLESSSREILEKEEILEQERCFLQDIQKRLERMRIDILYGSDQSKRLHSNQIKFASGKIGSKDLPDNDDDEDDEGELKSTPISKITILSHSLVELDQNNCSILYKNVIESVEKIGTKWERLVKRIDSINDEIKTKISPSKFANIEELNPLKNIPLERFKVKNLIRSPLMVTKQSRSIGYRCKEADLQYRSDEWILQNDLLAKWLSTKEKILLDLSLEKIEKLLNFHQNNDEKADDDAINPIESIQFDLPEDFSDCLRLYEELKISKNRFQQEHLGMILDAKDFDEFRSRFDQNDSISFDFETETLVSIDDEIILVDQMAQLLTDLLEKKLVQCDEKESTSEEKNINSPSDQEASKSSTMMMESLPSTTDKANKVRVAIEEFNHWLAKVIVIIDEYDDDNEETEEIESESDRLNGKDTNNGTNRIRSESRTETLLLETSVDGNDSQPSSLQQSKSLGLRLRSFQDLSNAIDHRIDILNDLHKIVKDEQQNYEFACRQAAEFIIGNADQNQQDLNSIETSLLQLSIEQFNDTQTIELIQSIQSLIKRWNLLFKKFNVLLPQLEDISPSITVLETEFSHLLRFVESSDEFLQEQIAIGDRDHLQIQLGECNKLKQYLEGSAESNFQTIIETVQKALRLLLGDDVFYDIVPVIKYINDTWTKLCDRIKFKLNRLEQAQRLTDDLVDKIDHYRKQIKEFEDSIQSDRIDELLKSNQIAPRSSELKFLKQSKIVDRLVYDVGQQKLLELTELKCDYNREVLDSNTGIINQINEFCSINGQTLSYEDLKLIATNEIPNSMDKIHKRLNEISELFGRIIDSFEKIDRWLTEQKEFFEKKNKTFYELVNKLREIERSDQLKTLQESFEETLISILVQNNLRNCSNEIKMLNTEKGARKYFQNIASVWEIFIKFNTELEIMTKDHNDLKPKFEQMIQFIENLQSESNTIDSKIDDLQNLIDRFDQNSIEQENLILAKHQELVDYIQSRRRNYLEYRLQEYANRLPERLRSIDDFIVSLRNHTMTRNESMIKQRNRNDRTVIVQTPSTIAMNVDDELTLLEKELADLEQQINEIAINFENDSENDESIIQQSIQNLIEDELEDSREQLMIFRKQFDSSIKSFTQQTSKSKSLSMKQSQRIKRIDSTWNALNESLLKRSDVYKELLQFCQEINQKLELLDAEINLNDEVSCTTSNFRQQKAQNIFKEICLLKENLDRFCIRYSDFLIGIEEVVAYYDELITMAAEHYLIIENETDDENIVIDDNVDAEPDSNLIIEEIVVEEMKQNESNQSLVEQKPDKVESGSSSKSSFEILNEDEWKLNKDDEVQKQSKMVEIDVKEIDNQSMAMIASKTQTKLSSPSLTYLTYQSRYVFWSHLIQLKRLERKIDQIILRRIPEMQQRRNHSKEIQMFPFLLEDELYCLNKSLNCSRTHLEQLLCIDSFFDPFRIFHPKSMRFDPIEVIEIKCSLHQGFESVKPIESLDQTEIVPKDFTKIGLSSYLDENWNEIDEMVQSNRDESSFTHQEWDQFYCQIKQLLFSLQNKFNQSDWTFLTLHRHLKLIHEDMIQFNVEIKKLSDWFENVELQINNGRVTMIDFDSLDQERFEKSELYLNVVARTQSLLITQFRTHLPSYGRLMMLYERILKHFTPETSEHFKEYRLDLKALLEAKNRIKHEMISIQKRWKIIVRELAWRRHCLIKLAFENENFFSKKSSPTHHHYHYHHNQQQQQHRHQYRLEIDKDLDELVKNHVQNELDHKDYRDSYPLDQLKQCVEHQNRKGSGVDVNNHHLHQTSTRIAENIYDTVADDHRDLVYKAPNDLPAMNRSQAVLVQQQTEIEQWLNEMEKKLDSIQIERFQNEISKKKSSKNLPDDHINSKGDVMDRFTESNGNLQHQLETLLIFGLNEFKK